MQFQLSTKLPASELEALLARKIAIIDGAMGSYLAEIVTRESSNHNYPLLNLTNPEIVKRVYKEYIEQGVDIITTNTFTAHAQCQTLYNLQDYVRRMNVAGVQIAHEAIRESQCHRPILVAASVGPTLLVPHLCTAQTSNNTKDAKDSLVWDELVSGYVEQISSLLEGHVDCLLLETMTHILTIKAALEAVKIVCQKVSEKGNSHDENTTYNKCYKLPIFVSVVLNEETGSLQSGEFLELFMEHIVYASNQRNDANLHNNSYNDVNNIVDNECVEACNCDLPFIMGIGVNCVRSTITTRMALTMVSDLTNKYIIYQPSAGLPDAEGHYHIAPHEIAMEHYLLSRLGVINVAGSCCGTSPLYQKAIANFLEKSIPRKVHFNTAERSMAKSFIVG